MSSTEFSSVLLRIEVHAASHARFTTWSRPGHSNKPSFPYPEYFGDRAPSNCINQVTDEQARKRADQKAVRGQERVARETSQLLRDQAALQRKQVEHADELRELRHLGFLNVEENIAV